MDTRELEKVLSIEDEDSTVINYNINAKSAEKVENDLIIKIIDKFGQTAEQVSFNGSTMELLELITAAGGKFKGPIRCQSQETEAELDDDLILNYSDLKNVVLKHLMNTSSLYSWDHRVLKPSIRRSAVSGISIVLGLDTEKDEFARANMENSALAGCLAAYLYWATDSRLLYFGTADSSEVIAIDAHTAKRLERSHYFRINLASTSAATFDGSQNRLIEPGVAGILPPMNGGTGKTNLEEVTVGQAVKAMAFTSPRQLYTNLECNNNTFFDGTDNTGIGVVGVLPAEHGGTGKSKLEDVVVGKANSVRVSTPDGTRHAIITTGPEAPKNPSIGDIWIKY